MAAAAREGAPPTCDYCSLACVLEEEDLVDVQCKIAGCADGKVVVYHRECLVTYFAKLGRQKDAGCRGNGTRDIDRMDITGAASRLGSRFRGCETLPARALTPSQATNVCTADMDQIAPSSARATSAMRCSE